MINNAFVFLPCVPSVKKKALNQNLSWRDSLDTTSNTGNFQMLFSGIQEIFYSPGKTEIKN
ncbi:hypothetical protein IQ259_09765 [Fortiea sp. LEGE XX443]|uniref:hypothetical protein n=1 Tax=Fortiea sp. LEGE XX443 TaxID=1828611 RepID=UPI00187F29F6|nr:hypothetical protein [Fortiea sp. LEGE XX443]MBE9005321.1 hypothetical protein [Fortiea sp. LEGE XX443]